MVEEGIVMEEIAQMELVATEEPATTDTYYMEERIDDGSGTYNEGGYTFVGDGGGSFYGEVGQSSYDSNVASYESAGWGIEVEGGWNKDGPSIKVKASKK